MVVAADLMVTTLVTCREDDTLQHVYTLMRDRSVRHLPVVDELGALVGLVTQKVLLREILLIASDRGSQRFEYYLGKRTVAEVVKRAVPAVSPTTPLKEVARFFLQSKQGCLPVIDNGQLVGIITSVDFVRLYAEQ